MSYFNFLKARETECRNCAHLGTISYFCNGRKMANDTYYCHAKKIPVVMMTGGLSVACEDKLPVTESVKYDEKMTRADLSKKLIIDQIVCVEEIQERLGYNLVTCPDCGAVIIVKRDNENPECPYCLAQSDASSFPDYLYNGIEDNFTPLED